VKSEKERGRHTLQTSERDGNDSSVGCPPMTQGNQLDFRSGRQAISRLVQSLTDCRAKSASQPFRALHMGGFKAHMAENSCRGIKVESAKEKQPPMILRISELRKLLTLVKDGFKVEAAEEEKAAWRKKFGSISILAPPMDMVPIITVGWFAGVRPDESARMEWEMIDFDRKHIDLPASITKDGQRRIVDMSDNLIEWLFLGRRPSGKILPEDFRRKGWALCREMSWKEWPDDVLRHSYGSYHLAKHRNAALTAEQMGHKNVRMLYAHYREVVKETSDVEEYWKLTPTLQPKIIPFAAEV